MNEKHPMNSVPMTELIDNPPPLPEPAIREYSIPSFVESKNFYTAYQYRAGEAAAFARGVAARQPEIDALRARIFKLEADRLQIKGAYSVEPSPNT